MKRVISLIVSLISLLSFSYAQTPQWINYTCGNNVYSLADEGNTLWLGTNGGLVKFDKTTESLTFYNASNLGLPHNDVRCIAIDGEWTKWIGTWDGLVTFDNTKWEAFNTSNSGLPNNNILSIAIEGGGTSCIGLMVMAW